MRLVRALGTFFGCWSLFSSESLRVVNKYPQTSISLDPDAVSRSPDLPLDEPPLARTVSGFEPEGIHITQWTHSSVLVSWQTGRPKIASNASPPTPYDPSKVAAFVKYGRRAGRYGMLAAGRPGDSLVYSYKYGPEAGNTTYHSPVLHHVLLERLRPGTTYHYRVGNDKDGWSPELRLRTLPAGFPLRLGVVGDLGQTSNSSVTLKHLSANKPHAVMLIGDFAYADDHLSGNTSGDFSFGTSASSEQPRWDAWARFTQPLLSRLPLISTRGNHEVEPLALERFATFTAAAARYPLPQDPAVVDTAPNDGSRYLNLSNIKQFANEESYRPRSAYYSVNVPGAAHIVSLNNYVPWGRTSAQYAWFKADLAKVDRSYTPWLIVIFHAAAYHTYLGHYKEGAPFLEQYERLFRKHGVDLVFSGHVHAYERTNPVFNYTQDGCGTMYTTIGDGGNIEGLVYPFIDTPPQPGFCANTSLFELPSYQPTPDGQPHITLQHGRFCPPSQPGWSAFRQPSFGHGMLELQSAERALWRWHRNTDEKAIVADEAVVYRGKSDSCRTRDQ